MRNNWTIITAVVIAIITATLAIMFRPVRKSGKWEPMTTAASTFTETTHESSTQTRKIQPSRVSTTEEVKIYTETETSAETTTEGATRVNKIVSKLQEIAEKDREWLKSRETISKSAEIEITPQEFRKDGIVYANGYRYTYYSERVLPGKGLKIPGRHSDGDFVRDGDGYICVASSDLAKGTVVETPFGKGKVYDTGCPSGTIDIYCSW